MLPRRLKRRKGSSAASDGRRRLSVGPTTHEMEVDVKHSLSGSRPDVGDYSPSILETLFPGDLCSQDHEFSQPVRVVCAQVRYRVEDVFLGNQQDVRRSVRFDVAKRIDPICLGNL